MLSGQIYQIFVWRLKSQSTINISVMKSRKLLLMSLLGFFLLILYFVLSSEPTNGDLKSTKNKKSDALYKAKLASQRKEKDVFFRTSPDSPLENKTAFAGLSYFPISPDYQLVARLEPFADKTQKLVITLSDGSEEVYEKYGHAVFKLQGEICRLLILKHDDTYSILFKDKTSGKNTYGGGRYIDLEESAFNETDVEIDFNTAYNPYCVYNHTYACPLPPAENTLPIAVEAGEMLPK